MNKNKLIAEFMGYEVHPVYEDERHDLQYHTSWDWLMPVVEKCYHNGADSNEIGDITHALLDINIEATHQAVIKFIENYE